MTKIDSQILMLLRKSALIEAACGRIRYSNHGVDEPFCEELMRRPTGDLGKLVAYDYGKDMCDEGIVETRIVDVPAATMRGLVNLNGSFCHSCSFVFCLSVSFCLLVSL